MTEPISILLIIFRASAEFTLFFGISFVLTRVLLDLLINRKR